MSIKSVSRVLNREANVSGALPAKVDQAVAEPGYRRSLSARSLAGSASSIIVVALVDAELTIEHWRSGRGNDYLSRLELGVLMECRKADFHLMVELVDHASSSLRRDLSSLLAAIRPEGVLLATAGELHLQGHGRTSRQHACRQCVGPAIPRRHSISGPAWLPRLDEPPADPAEVEAAIAIDVEPTTTSRGLRRWTAWRMV